MGDVAGRPAEHKQLIHASQTAAHKMLSPPELQFFLCNITDREGGGVGLQMRSKLEYLLFRSMWETYTYFCVHFQSHYSRLKLLQSFWYMLYLFLV
jgi:hypothetical protein